ncbi:MAG: phage protein GemA/Gp16 family protein [Stenotrophomonas sp.]|uniref:phage protein GemA/Gp16 family protein n=1 Tax=Stenotrophomonas sp. TaxID=69392 RepID=UPI003D6D21DD
MTRMRQAGGARNRVLAAIHAGAKKLGLPEDVYRDLVQRVSAEHGEAVRSAAKCSPQQLSAIANELRRLGGMPAKRDNAAEQWAGRPKGDLSPQLAKVEALLTDAHRPWAYVHSMATRMFKVTRIEWCNKDQLQKVIAALQYDANRHSSKAAAR